MLSCQRSYFKSTIKGQRLELNENIVADPTIDTFIEPYRNHLNASLDSVISYAPDTYSKKNGELNTAIGNLMADAVYAECNPIFEKRHSKNIDFVLLNHGGIRAEIPKGQITLRTAYKVMPFENAVVVVALKGEQIQQMINYLSKAKRAHPLSSQIQITLNDNYEFNSATIDGKSIEDKKIYYVATNDYLYNGGDRMEFFKTNEGAFELNYKIRNVLIDHFKKTDTLSPTIDNRFIKETLK